MRKVQRSIYSVILCIVLMAATVSGTIITHATDEADNYYTDVTTIPSKEGCVFAGWYQDKECTNPYRESDKGNYEAAYAKFVSADVLSVKCQLAADATMASASTDLRLVTTVDSLKYQSVGFIVSAGEKGPRTLESNTVYSSISAFVNANKTTYTPQDLAADANYFMTSKITDIPSEAFATTFSVTPFWKTMDGTTVTGAEKVFTIKENLPVSITSAVEVADSNLRFNINADDGMPLNGTPTYYTWSSGGIYVNGQRVNVAMIKYAATAYMIYFTWGNEVTPIAGTEVKIDGTMTDGTNAVTFLPTSFVYDGTSKWIKYDENKEVTISEDPSKEGKELFFTVSGNDTIAKYNDLLWSWKYGGVYVNDSETSVTGGVPLIKHSATGYYVYFGFGNYATVNPVEGMKVKIDGILTDGTNEVKFLPATFLYNGTKWIKYDKEVTMSAVANQGTNLVLIANEDTQIADGWYAPTYGGFYKADGTYVYIPMQKAGNYYFFWQNGMPSDLPLQEGLTLTLDAVYKDATYTVKFNRVTFRFDGANWETVTE